MKKFLQMFTIAIVAMTTTFFLPGCGEFETVNKSSDDCPDGYFRNMRTDEQGQVCLPNHCESSVKDADETATDCGGSCNEAYRCSNGLACVVNKDCVSDRCVAGSCVGRPNGDSCDKGQMCQSQVCEAGKCVGGSTLTCTSNSQCSGGAKVCFSTGCGDCVNDGQCGSANLECKAGSCVARSNTCGSGCSTGTVCVDNSCVPGQAQGFLCATPQVAITMTCWNQNTGGVQDAVHSVAASQQVCCPAVSGSFTTSPFTTAGTYTGYQGTNITRSFQTWTNNLSQQISGGYK